MQLRESGGNHDLILEAGSLSTSSTLKMYIHNHPNWLTFNHKQISNGLGLKGNCCDHSVMSAAYPDICTEFNRNKEFNATEPSQFLVEEIVIKGLDAHYHI